MDIIIGREEGVRRLHCIANGREFNIGQAGCVPTSVSRKHCKIVINGSTMSVENLKPQNVTFVDGNLVFSKGITSTSKLQLGNEKYTVPLQELIQLATGKSTTTPTTPPKPEVPTFTLKPLKTIWDKYDRRKLEIQEAATKAANMSRIQGILSMAGMCIGFIPGIDPSVRIVVIVIALLAAVYFFVKGMSNDSVQKQLRDLDEEYSTKYKCPNPACGKPFGNIPYRQIEYNKQCLACGCQYTH